MAELTKEKFRIVGIDKNKAEQITRPNLTYWQDAWRRLKRNKVAMISLCVLVVIILFCIIQPIIAGDKYMIQDMSIANQGPSIKHLFGTDNLGRDLFDRLWIGGRVSLIIAFVGTLVECVVGIIYGGISGYFGGKLDNIMMRIVDIINSIPMTIYVILLMVMFEKGGLFNIIIALSVSYWISMARIVRGEILQLKQQEFVLAAKTLGASGKRILFKHLIPNCLGSIIVTLTLQIPTAIFTEAFLSFIGLGIAPPAASWGTLANDALQSLRLYPYQLLFPTLAICLTILSFNLLGDGLRDALDPKVKK